jgi:enoyl-CoA hydratase
VEFYLESALKLAREVAARPPIAARLAKESVLKSFDTTINDGLEFERKNFYLLFDTEDMREGMAAFLQKRKAEWKGK